MNNRSFFKALRVYTCAGLALAVAMCAAQARAEARRTLAVSIAEPLILEVTLSSGNLQIAYAREGEISISSRTISSVGTGEPEDLSKSLTIEQAGNHLTIHEANGPVTTGIRREYSIDVPYRTEVHVSMARGNTSVTGVMGPVDIHSGTGGINVSYVSDTVTAQAESGDLDLKVIGGHIQASTGLGNISCTRAALGISAATNSGDITLAVVGKAEATVKSGSGRITAEGIRGALVASTAAGDVHVRAVPHDNWHLHSVSGPVRVELPPQAGFDLDATTDGGEVVVRRDDLSQPAAPAHHFSQKANGGGKQIEIRSGSGTIVIG